MISMMDKLQTSNIFVGQTSGCLRRNIYKTSYVYFSDRLSKLSQIERYQTLYVKFIDNFRNRIPFDNFKFICCGTEAPRQV